MATFFDPTFGGQVGDAAYQNQLQQMKPLNDLITSGQYRDIPGNIVPDYLGGKLSLEDAVAKIKGTPIYDPTRGPVLDYGQGPQQLPIGAKPNLADLAGTIKTYSLKASPALDASLTPTARGATVGVTIPTAPRVPITSTYTGPSIVDYLTSINQDSSMTSRKTLAEKYGITGYRGTAAQNDSLLAAMRANPMTAGSVKEMPGGAPSGSYQEGKYYPGKGTYMPDGTFSAAVPANTTGPQSALGLGSLPGLSGTGTNTGANAANAMVTGAQQTAKQIDAYLASIKPTKSDTQKEADTLTSDLKTLLPKQMGQAQALADEETKRGVDTLRTKLADVNGQIATKTAEYQKLTTDVEGKPITMNSIIGSERAIINAKAADIGLQQATALALTGQISAAEDAAKRAVDLKYAPILEEINVKQQQLALLTPTLTKEETQRAEAANKMYDAQKTLLTIEVANAKDKSATLLNLLQAYPDAGITLNDTLESASAKVSSSKIYQDKIKSLGAGTPEQQKQLAYAAADKFLSDNPNATYDELRGGLLQNTILNSTEVDALLQAKGKGKDDIISPPTDYVDLAKKYQEAGWSKEQILGAYPVDQDGNSKIPAEFAAALDQVYPEPSWWDSFKNWFTTH